MRKSRFRRATSIEQRFFDVDGTQIPVEFRYSSRRATTSFRLSKKGYVCNTNPRIPSSQIDEFVRKCIRKMTLKQMEMPRPINQDDVYIFGENMHIDGFSSWSKQKQNKCLKDILLPYVAEANARYEKLLGIDAEYEVKVRDAHSVYGVNHRDKRTIMYSMSLVHFSKHTIDSVVAHELTHHFVLGHGAKFYKILLSVVPDYWESRRKLIRNIYG